MARSPVLQEQSLPPFALILSKQPLQEGDTDPSVAELEQLLEGLGVRTVAHATQRHRSGERFPGTGKLQEITDRLKELSEEHGTEVFLAVDGEISPGQLRFLEEATDTEVIDRTGVVLRIFEQRARSTIARMEIEIARLEYEAPRVRERKATDTRQGGGGRGERGHTNVELEKRRIRERIATLRSDLESHVAREDRQRAARRDALSAALVGYTNAGKSALMTALTGGEVLVEDKLFATLGTTVRALSPAVSPPVLVSDTVGFIRNLPHSLVASFRSTLAEARESSLLLHVIDASDPEFREQIRTTNQGLEAVGAGDMRTLAILNKIDRLTAAERVELSREFPDAVQISALDPADVARLREAIAAAFDEDLVSGQLQVPFAMGHLIPEIRARARIIEEAHTEEGVILSVRSLPYDLKRWQSVLGDGRLAPPAAASSAVEV